MNIAFALDYIPRRMEELGYGLGYTTRYMHLRVNKLQTLTIEAYNQILLLITPETNIQVASARGVFDAEDSTIAIQQHEHSGKVSIKNKSFSAVLVLFIKVIPLNTKKKQK